MAYDGGGGRKHGSVHSRGLTYLIALILILARPARWRVTLWLSQVLGFGATCFVLDWIGLGRPLVESLALALAGGGVGVLAAWRWFAIAQDVAARARSPARRS